MLSPGARLGPYEVVSPLGAGGMGEVYRARDTKLDRDVALKVLPEAFTADADRLARFEREAKVLASLNHPNIGHIYGLEEADGQKALVLELIEGPTLADRIAQGPILLDEALPIARQIAEALEAAHEQGIIHRDLKPANVKVRPDGTVKVLDFGLAKAFEAQGDDPDASQSPTLTARASEIGVILGTAGYMAPEQARGKPVDKRADIWAFGVVLFEMLSGTRAFRGEDVSQTLARVIDRDPDWGLLPRETPPGVGRLLQRCLRKDRGSRLHDVADARLELEEAGEPSSTVPGNDRRPTSRMRLVPWGISALMAVLAAAVAGRSWIRPVPRPARAHLQITLPEGLRLATETTHPTLALSPDGSRLAFVASDGRTRRLYVRDLGDRQARAIEGTEGAGSPFFSPDGEWIAFIAGMRLMRVSSSGGAPTLLSPAWMPVSVNRGGTWTPAESLVVSGSPNSGLSAGPVSGESGPVDSPHPSVSAEDPLAGRMAPRPLPGMRQVTDPTAAFTWPMALPDGRNVLFTDNSREGLDAAQVAGLSLTSDKVTQFGVVGSNPRYSSTGHILYGRGGTLYATPFDAVRGTPAGPESELVDGVRSESNGAVHYAVGGDGTLAYVAGPGLVEYELVWIDRQGRTETLLESGEQMFTPRLSPDASEVALTIGGVNADVWLFDLERKSLTRRLTTHRGEDFGPVWHPDGRQLAVSTELDDTAENPGPGMAWMPEPGGPLESLIHSPGWGNWEFPSSWSPDGASLAFLVRRTGRADIGLTSLDERGEWVPFLETAAMEAAPAFSPDGRWLAYVSDETGRDEVYVRPFPGPGQRTPTSSGGGTEPVWARDGRELFFRSGDRIMGARVDGSGRDFVAGTAEPVVVGVVLDDFTEFGAEIPNYDVSPDGTRFVMARRREAGPATVIDVVLNWPETLRGASEVDR